MKNKMEIDMRKNINFILNDKKISVNVNSAKSLLDFIRNDANLKGTKEGCKEGDCGACTVLLGELVEGKLRYKSVNSCLFPIYNVRNKHVVTIEGLTDQELSPIQNELNEHAATQCGFCTPGFVNSLTNYVIQSNNLNFEDAQNTVAGNICRCTGYASINRAIASVIEKLNRINFTHTDKITKLVEEEVLPKYFLDIKNMLAEIEEEIVEDREFSKIIAGGTDLYVQQPDKLLNQKNDFVSDYKLEKIVVNNNICEIGSGVTIEELKTSEVILKFYPNLKKQLNLFASKPIRNSATIGGNIVNASPIGDSIIIFLALNAKLEIGKKGESREVYLKDFYKGYKQLDLDTDEIVKKIFFKLPNSQSFFNFEKVSKRTHLDIASVNSAINIELKEDVISQVYISAGGINPIPTYLKNTSEFLLGKSINSGLIIDAIKIAQTEISPISDIRGSEKYKRLLLGQLIKAHFIELFPDKIKDEDLL